MDSQRCTDIVTLLSEKFKFSLKKALAYLDEKVDWYANPTVEITKKGKTSIPLPFCGVKVDDLLQDVPKTG